MSLNQNALHFFDHTPSSWQEATAAWSMPPYSAQQLFHWVYTHRVTAPETMSNLSKQHRALLTERVTFFSGDVIRHQRATDGTQKLLIGWHKINAQPGAREAATDVSRSKPLLSLMTNGQSDLRGTGAERQTETVVIPTELRRTACVSSQVGCPVGCRFCASGLRGVEGNLQAGQIVEQVYRLNLLPAVGRVTNVVFMGMGEPLANFQQVTQAIRILNAEWGLGIGARKITVSTVGLPAAIRKLVKFEIPVTLALSLHAPNDELRRELIPWAQYTTIDELLDACEEYFAKTGREITLEYVLLGEVNDRPEHARELADVAARLRANVNLIRYNEVAELPFQRPSDPDVHRFQSTLQRHRINTHIRASRGRDIAAACGQLRQEQAGANR